MTILTPPVISRLPLGLLGFFGIKNGGQYPQTLGNSIIPTLEQLELLAANYHTNIAFIANPTVAGWTAAVPSAAALAAGAPNVPVNEVWYVSTAGMHLSTGAGDAINASAAVRGVQFGVNAAFYHALSDPFTLAASQNYMYTCKDGFWMEPGDQLGFWANSVTSVTGIIINIQCKISRFPI